MIMFVVSIIACLILFSSLVVEIQMIFPLYIPVFIPSALALPFVFDIITYSQY